MAGSPRNASGAPIPAKSSNDAPLQSATPLAGLPAKAHNHIDFGDFVALGRKRDSSQRDLGIGDVDQRIFAFDKEMMMLGRIGVEKGLGAIDGQLAQQPDFGELVQRVVYGRERDGYLGLERLFVKPLGRD